MFARWAVPLLHELRSSRTDSSGRDGWEHVVSRRAGAGRHLLRTDRGFAGWAFTGVFVSTVFATASKYRGGFACGWRDGREVRRRRVRLVGDSLVGGWKVD